MLGVEFEAVEVGIGRSVRVGEKGKGIVEVVVEGGGEEEGIAA